MMDPIVLEANLDGIEMGCDRAIHYFAPGMRAAMREHIKQMIVEVDTAPDSINTDAFYQAAADLRTAVSTAGTHLASGNGGSQFSKALDDLSREIQRIRKAARGSEVNDDWRRKDERKATPGGKLITLKPSPVGDISEEDLT